MYGIVVGKNIKLFLKDAKIITDFLFKKSPKYSLNAELCWELLSKGRERGENLFWFMKRYMA